MGDRSVLGLAAAVRLLPALLACLAAALAGAVTVEEALTRDPVFDPEHPPGLVELSISVHGSRLPAHLYRAAGPGPHPTVVLLHGLPGNERNLDIAQALRRFGFNTLYFHYRGAWGAEGEYRFTQLADDTLAVLDYLRDAEVAAALSVDPGALSLLGHSLGGFAALAAGSRDPALACVISLSPANLGLWQKSLLAGKGADWLAEYADALFMLEGLTGQRLVEELMHAAPAALDTPGFGPGLQGKSLLMVVGEQDTVTPAETMFDPVVESYRKIADLDLTALTLSGDHSFSWSRLALTRSILDWADGRCRGG